MAQQIEQRSRAGNHRHIAGQTAAESVLTRDLDEAVALANAYAPSICAWLCAIPGGWLNASTAAGGIFVGEHSFEVLGDYVAGPSHVMPTGGSARFASPLNVLDFVHIVSLVALDEATTRQIAPAAAEIALARRLGCACLFRPGALMKTAQRFDRLPPYTPIEPFEVLSARLGLPAEQIIKLDANENPYGPSPRARQALAASGLCRISIPTRRAARCAPGWPNSPGSQPITCWRAPARTN